MNTITLSSLFQSQFIRCSLVTSLALALIACTVPTMQLTQPAPTENDKPHATQSLSFGSIRVQQFYDARPKVQKQALRRYFKKTLPEGIFSGKTTPDLPTYLRKTLMTVGQAQGLMNDQPPFYLLTGTLLSAKVEKKPGTAKELTDPKVSYIPYIGASYYQATVQFEAQLRQAGLVLTQIPIKVTLFEVAASKQPVQEDSDEMALLLEKAVDQATSKLYQKLQHFLVKTSTIVGIHSDTEQKL